MDFPIGNWLRSHPRPNPRVRARRLQLGIRPVFKSVDTCAAEFEAYTPYYYSTYEAEDELPPKGDKKRVVILGGGPNRIGQGIEFDYCCCHASFRTSRHGHRKRDGQQQSGDGQYRL